MAKILVTHPLTGSTLRVGSTYEIKWESIGGVLPDVSITLRESSGGTQVGVIDATASNTGSYFWKVPLNLDPDTDYSIRVADATPITGDGTDFTVAEKFSITEFARLEKFKKLVIAEMKTGFTLDTIFIGDMFLLKEDGDFLLLESGDKIILDQSVEA